MLDNPPNSATTPSLLRIQSVLAILAALSLLIGMTGPSFSQDRRTTPRVVSGAEVLVDSGFEAVAGKRVGLITNHTGLVRGEHLADLFHKAKNVTLAAILAPEHGFRGAVEAGETVRDGVDTKTGVPVLSLYGRTRKPTQAMLKNIDVLVFDIQDIGARFYTYISTMGLAMQAAAQAKIPFIVLDRPNPLGGEYVSGFVLEPKYSSFVGQYPIPIVHGMTVSELASMIKGEKWLKGLETLDLGVMKMEGWQRSMRWPETGREWVATSPNIPTFACALVYPGIGIIGETQLVNEGRGTPAPFTVFGAPWLDAKKMTAHLNSLKLPGVKFEAARYKPRPIPRVATNPLFVGQTINGVRVVVTDVSRVEPLEVGIHALTRVLRQARANGRTRLFRDVSFFNKIAGTHRMHRMLVNGDPGSAIVTAWKREAAAFKAKRRPYLLY